MKIDLSPTGSARVLVGTIAITLMWSCPIKTGQDQISI